MAFKLLATAAPLLDTPTLTNRIFTSQDREAATFEAKLNQIEYESRLLSERAQLIETHTTLVVQYTDIVKSLEQLPLALNMSLVADDLSHLAALSFSADISHDDCFKNTDLLHQYSFAITRDLIRLTSFALTHVSDDFQKMILQHYDTFCDTSETLATQARTLIAFEYNQPVVAIHLNPPVPLSPPQNPSVVPIQHPDLESHPFRFLDTKDLRDKTLGTLVQAEIAEHHQDQFTQILEYYCEFQSLAQTHDLPYSTVTVPKGPLFTTTDIQQLYEMTTTNMGNLLHALFEKLLKTYDNFTVSSSEDSTTDIHSNFAELLFQFTGTLLIYLRDTFSSPSTTLPLLAPQDTQYLSLQFEAIRNAFIDPESASIDRTLLPIYIFTSQLTMIMSSKLIPALALLTENDAFTCTREDTPTSSSTNSRPPSSENHAAPPPLRQRPRTAGKNNKVHPIGENPTPLHRRTEKSCCLIL